MEIVSINIGKPHSMIVDGKELITGIVKSPVSSSLHLSKLQLEGDGQADLVNHGGEDKALCVYCEEHYPDWERKLRRKLAYGSFGENITVGGLLESDVSIGDVYQLGEAVVQVTQPRQPCYKLASKHGMTDLPMQVQDTGFTGYYFRVLVEGALPVQPKLRLITKHAAGITIEYANRIKYHDKNNAESIKRILAVAELSLSWRESFERRLAELGK